MEHNNKNDKFISIVYFTNVSESAEQHINVKDSKKHVTYKTKLKNIMNSINSHK